MNKHFIHLATVLMAAVLSLTVGISAASAQVTGVRLKGGKLVLVEGGKESPLQQNVLLTDNLLVATNGTFRVGSGKERALKEGQTLNKDGLLMGTDGSITPVWDHLTMRRGALVQVKDGEVTPVTKDVTMSDGTRIGRDGTMRLPNGSLKRFLDGQILTLDGRFAGAADSATLKNGQVVVQKDGTQFTIRRDQTLMMNEGTRVLGNGTVISPDGKSSKLQEGEVRTFQGVR
jgi:hypothetical protein